MAQRRSRNRRSSARRSSNVSCFLDDNTNIIDNNDPQWYNRTILRPSTSFVLTKTASSILNPDSMADETQMSNNWYKNLSRSESSKLMEEIVRSKVNNRNNESVDSTRVEPVTESESETESQRKRTKLRVNQKKVNMSDKSNVFSRALEKTTESRIINLTVQMPEGNESESTNDDSRTIKRIKPALFRNNKRSKENSNFDDLFHSDSTTENLQASTRNSRSSLKRKSKELIVHTSTPEVAHKFKKTQLEKLDEVDSTQLEKSGSVNKTLDKTLLVTPATALRNRSILGTSTNKTPMKSSQKQAGSATVYDSVDMSLTIVENKSQKKRAALFSQESRTNNDKNLFDEIFDDEDDDDEPNPSSANELVKDVSSGKTQEQNPDDNREANESETSSIPKYIRRTRSVVLRKLNSESEDEGIFDSQRENNENHEKTNEEENEKSRQSLKQGQDHNASRRSLRASQIINNSRNVTKSQSELISNKSFDHTNRTAPNVTLNRKSYESSSGSKVIEKAKHLPYESSDDEIIINVSKSTKASAAQNDAEHEDFHDSLKHGQGRSESQRSLRDRQNIKNSRNSSETQSILNSNKSLKKTNTATFNQSLINKGNKSSSSSKALEKTKHVSYKSSDDEDTINTSKSKKSIEAQGKTTKSFSQHEALTPDLTFDQFQKSPKPSNKSSRKSKNAQDSVDEHADNEHGNTITPEITNKPRSRLFKSRTKVSDGENAFDKILDTENSAASQKSKVTISSQFSNYILRKIDVIIKLNGFNHLINVQRSSGSLHSKESMQSLNDTRTYSRSVNKSVLNHSENSFQANKSVANENTRNNSQQDESEDENSTIPNHIRRTRSRLFQRSEIVENNAFDDVLNAGNSEANQSFQNNSQSQKSQSLKLSVSQDSNKTLQRSVSHLREAKKQYSQTSNKPQVMLQRVECPKASGDSCNDSLKENHRGNNFQKSTKKLNPSMNKGSPTISDLSRSNVEDGNSSTNLTNASNRVGEQSFEKSNAPHADIEENTNNEGVPSRRSSIETSSDGTPKSKPNKNLTTPHIPEKSINEDYLSDDLLHTPNPAQSTLKISGKRITQFALRNSIINEIDSPHSPTSSNRGPSPPAANSVIANEIGERQSEKEIDDNEDEDVEVDIINNSDVSEYPMLTRHLNDIPYEAEKSTSEEEAAPFLSAGPLTSKATKTKANENTSTIEESVWVEVKKKTDALKVIMETQKKQQEAIQREREHEKARTEAKLKRAMAQRAAELKKQRKKPIDKAYYVNGKLYKQPKLPVPKKWVTDRLYKYLWKHMEPKFGLSARIQSEKFVMKLSNVFTVVTRRKKYENYKEDVDDLMVSMAELGIIKDRYDFYRFCREYMPYSFRIKVVPMQLPGNLRNIPYEPELVHKPILPDRSGSYESRSNSDSNSKSNDKNESGSSSESE
ncbi:hypothetical protein TSAR_010873 [Trichomalopsis sarcophagae]|uniref:Uncharacterized protein n=1 Tax=Trichomalopsis sarcophagae TaxID=543379 RepID=A0A232F485_9HYME|nr:hypothetical protein TSAR_010873 [Trichomalopsis sarcophagae]